MSCLSFASARARLGGVIVLKRRVNQFDYVAGHTFKLRECIPGTGYRVQGLLQLRVLRFGFLQDGDVGVGVFPEGEKILVRCFRFSGVALQECCQQTGAVIGRVASEQNCPI